ncbi:metallophosphoesterase [Microbulbifer pacificus]|uniref:Metallophosphoesterase n=1 Tax=Microbulbifer pacificus TaxID=407164 RepID=A0AAU0MW72_9GAMM|nr:metallophosphoesterase [Microbulbifer pacificus]WOX04719.1 metallophosphoesterase [Microbulbifer pacificus]
MSTYWKIDRNREGRDFVVGDVHGHLRQLQIQLAALGFTPCVDRLFFLGDIVDRGLDSEALIDLIDQRTYFSILGNHEAMTIAGFENSSSIQLHKSNGGAWFYKLPSERQQAIVEKIRTWPWAVEIDCGAKHVGLVHADVPKSNWNLVKTLLGDISDAWSKKASLDDPEIEQVAQPLLWRRTLVTHLYQDVLEFGDKKRTFAGYKLTFLDRISKLRSVGRLQVCPFEIEGIDSVCMGHSYVPMATNVGNCYFLDSYRGEPGEELSVLCVNQS